MKKLSPRLLICIGALILAAALFIWGAVRGGIGPGSVHYLFALILLAVALFSFPRWGELPRPLQTCVLASLLCASQFISGATRDGVGPGAYNYLAALAFLIVAVGSFLYWLNAKREQPKP